MFEYRLVREEFYYVVFNDTFDIFEIIKTINISEENVTTFPDLE